VVVRALIEASADVNMAMDDGATPLLIAAEIGHEPVVQILRDAGAV
jgi:ankyrin repeat protein